VTPRAAIRDALEHAALSALELSERVGVREKEIPEHLEHLERSLKARGEGLSIEPASCLACGFVFKERRRFTSPGSCPRCRSERIVPPVFRVVPRAGEG
jgi:predicted Zn-ribbon and HTH transcriptional regulator